MPSLKLKALYPKHTPTTRQYTEAMERGVMKTAMQTLRDFESTVRTWDHKPVFDVTITRTGGDFQISAGTDNLIYLFVSEGTKPHTIAAKRSPYLIFQGGYKAKTRVGIIGSNAGGRDENGDWFRKKQVQHPGFPGRQFIGKIRSRRQKSLSQNVSHEIALVNRTVE